MALVVAPDVSTLEEKLRAAARALLPCQPVPCWSSAVGPHPPLQCAVALYIYSKLAIALPGGQRHWSMRRRVGPPPGCCTGGGPASWPEARQSTQALRAVPRKQDCTLLCTSSTQTGRQGCRELVLCAVCTDRSVRSARWHLLPTFSYEGVYISLVVSLFVYTKVYFISAAPVPLGVYLPYYRTEL